MNGLSVFDLGLIDFDKASKFQQEIFELVRKKDMRCGLIFCRHHPVITIGRRGRRENILLAESGLIEQGIAVCQATRAGDVTYHGPGQLTVYPVCDLSLFKRDIHAFLRMLEKTLIAVLKDFGITAGRIDGLTGVWVGNKKIASLGIAVRNWITLHGISINVMHEDLRNFLLIRPCGMDIAMTSMESELGTKIAYKTLQETVIRRFPYDQSYAS